MNAIAAFTIHCYLPISHLPSSTLSTNYIFVVNSFKHVAMWLQVSCSLFILILLHTHTHSTKSQLSTDLLGEKFIQNGNDIPVDLNCNNSFFFPFQQKRKSTTRFHCYFHILATTLSLLLLLLFIQLSLVVSEAEYNACNFAAFANMKSAQIQKLKHEKQNQVFSFRHKKKQRCRQCVLIFLFLLLFGFMNKNFNNFKNLQTTTSFSNCLKTVQRMKKNSIHFFLV